MFSFRKYHLRLFFLTCAVGALFVFAFGGMQSERTRPLSITGKVSYLDDGTPDFCSLSLGSQEHFEQTGCDSEGKYGFFDLPFGTYNMLAFGASEKQAGTFTKEGIVISEDTKLPVIIDIVLFPPEQ